MSGAADFDYEGSLWGAETVRPGEWTIAGFRLEEALVHLPRTGALLEVGCGAGRFLRALQLSRPQLVLTGVDVSRAALQRLAQLAPDLSTRVVEGAALPATDGEFDAVLALDVLEHVSDPDAMLAEIWRVLAPGGVVHLHVPCEADPLCLWRWLPGQSGPRALKRRFGGHVQRFRRRELLARIEASGFETLRVRHSLHLLGNLADVALFAGMALARRLRPGAAAATSGDVVARGAERASVAGWVVRAVDTVLWCEAQLLGRMPSWSLHVSARKLA